MNTLQNRKNFLLEKFKNLEWEERYKLIIAMGRQLAPYPSTEQVQQWKVTGCQAQVWVKPTLKKGRLLLAMNSDALIVKGLLALLYALYNEVLVEEVLEDDTKKFVKELGLSTHLTPTRVGGLFSVIKQIKIYAFIYSKQDK